MLCVRNTGLMTLKIALMRQQTAINCEVLLQPRDECVVRCREAARATKLRQR